MSLRLFIGLVLAWRLAIAQAEVVVIMIRSTTSGNSLLTGLLASWHFEEASGNRLDSSGNGLTLTDNNTVGSTSSGKIGNAIVIVAGVSEFLSRVDGATLSIGTPVSFTFDGWVFPTAFDANYVIIAKGDDVGASSFEYRIYHPSANQIRFRVSNGSAFSEVTSASGTSPINTWTYFRATLDIANSQIELELNNNGTLIQAAMQTGGCWDSTKSFFVGNLPNAAAYAGRIDEVHFWKRVLTTTEQSDLYNSGNGLLIP